MVVQKISFLASMLLLACSLDASLVHKLIRRSRRNYEEYYGQDDNSLARAYWNLPVEMGVYVNPEAVSYVNGASFKRSDSPLHPGGSGSGSGSGDGIFTATAKRNKIPAKPKNSFKTLVDKSRSDSQLSKKSELFAVANTTTTTAEERDIVVQGEDDKAKLTETVTCEGEKEWLQCPTYHLIKVHSAFWGRDKANTCTRSSIAHGLKTDKMCAQDEANTMAKVQNACDGENACELVASQLYFDRTDCSDVYKYLRLNWACAKSESRIKDSLEREEDTNAMTKSGIL